MFEYIFGKIVSIESSYIVLENNNIGYLIYVSNPYSYKENNDYKVYIYQHIREDENTLYGFKSKEEKNLFLRLIISAVCFALISGEEIIISYSKSLILLFNVSACITPFSFKSSFSLLYIFNAL